MNGLICQTPGCTEPGTGFDDYQTWVCEKHVRRDAMLAFLQEREESDGAWAAVKRVHHLIESELAEPGSPETEAFAARVKEALEGDAPLAQWEIDLIKSEEQS